MTRQLVCFIMILLSAQSQLFAQGEDSVPGTGKAVIEGTISHDTGPLEFSTIILMDGEEIVAGANSDQNGFYKLSFSPRKSRNYIVTFSFAAVKKTTTVEITEGDVVILDMNFGTELDVTICYESLPEDSVRQHIPEVEKGGKPGTNSSGQKLDQDYIRGR